jgi:hypothetical protein
MNMSKSCEWRGKTRVTYLPVVTCVMLNFPPDGTFSFSKALRPKIKRELPVVRGVYATAKYFANSRT